MTDGTPMIKHIMKQRLRDFCIGIKFPNELDFELLTREIILGRPDPIK